MTRSFLPGLELAARFYTEVVAPILDRALDGIPYSAALIGWGSEVQGFDTVRSTDHAWGPRMQLFLGGADFLARRDDLDALLDRELPVEFRGYPVRFAFPPDTPARHWVHVTGLRDFFTWHLGADPADGLSIPAWLAVPTQVLRELTGGMVFHDGLGLLEPYRKLLAWYPDDVWRYVLACQWMRLSQEEPFVGRCGEVGDDLGSAVVAARQVRDLMKLCLLMNRVYPPYSKWLGTAFAALPCARALTPYLSGALSARGWQEREQHLSPAYEIAARLHNDLGLTEPIDGTVRYFHDRPFLVLDAYRFTDALVATISDAAVRALPPVGAIDQYVDSTDLTDRSHFEVRRRYLAGPGLVL
ncbi:DUF4037 domain-containing protein [Amycolatopsis oliviviridis]|uniref:DUF4037 domain-containing protein n=1 Tax=Amycolatopsis oliviviridis TaxID=1471590 RepID=A0ABQ3MKN9_9PSEU|nr:DUF4037 domain-containing protein [Amycolatopsis oliviviridis]GHH37768.1 hypothetical protein GCM10017790_82590 [Amycolatopsis oliviviridis]